MFKAVKTFKELMMEAYGREGECSSLSPRKGLVPPDADDFFAVLREMFGTMLDALFTADVQYDYQELRGYGWYAFGRLYIAVPEHSLYECHEGEWTSAETLVEAVQHSQHEAWRREEETRQFKNEINNILSKL